ncbi:DUF2971 domain-containing protein [Mesorhizobium sp. CO1-1-4]|uniref:DUF2971 domain-containing protein n=1 Tax=Mesorhizobium sp. CO1-1-4 TaxID=2876633 RepID=UPI001CCA1118|nr:DUF2971 domain-containing protein [Mesorhizobium sp. CO1-1-4]MBZ9742235.1 DUF2971 domain-containing protein [Mesorhizobium sp. CO1-1-4]
MQLLLGPNSPNATQDPVLAEQIIKPHAISELFSPLYEESRQADDWIIGKRPLLAHYTSIQTLEKILEKEELWLSNPLFMNDLDELRFGMIRGKAIFDQTDIEKECGLDAEKSASIREAFALYYSEYENKHALNVYILCLSEHDTTDTDGILSMWRAYANNGNGAAIVFDTKVIGNLVEDSPFVLVKVRYASTEERLQWLKKTVLEWCQIVAKSVIPPDLLYVAAYQLFYLILVFALSAKHKGFKEENEWRLIYMPDRDHNQLLKDKFHYAVGPRGVEPKLILKVAPMEGAIPDFRFSEIVERVLLGPSISSPLATASVARMLEKLGKPELVPKVHSSTIPLRPSWPVSP